MLALLGLLLVKSAISSVGKDGVISVFKYFGSSDFIDFLKLPITIRYYGIVINLLVFVFLLIPNIDFFVASVLFLLTFFFMFYCGSDQDLPLLISQILGAAIVLGAYLFSGLAEKVNAHVPFSADVLVIIFIGLLVVHYYRKYDNPEFKRKFKISLLIGFLAPFTIGIIFKYFLLVPMPHEGIIVSLLDAVWYADIWS